MTRRIFVGVGLVLTFPFAVTWAVLARLTREFIDAFYMAYLDVHGEIASFRSIWRREVTRREPSSRWPRWWCELNHRHATAWSWDCQADVTTFRCRICKAEWTRSGGPS